MGDVIHYLRDKKKMCLNTSGYHNLLNDADVFFSFSLIHISDLTQSYEVIHPTAS